MRVYGWICCRFMRSVLIRLLLANVRLSRRQWCQPAKAKVSPLHHCHYLGPLPKPSRLSALIRACIVALGPFSSWSPPVAPLFLLFRRYTSHGSGFRVSMRFLWQTMRVFLGRYCVDSANVSFHRSIGGEGAFEKVPWRHLRISDPKPGDGAWKMYLLEKRFSRV